MRGRTFAFALAACTMCATAAPSLDVLTPGAAIGTSDSEYDGLVRTVFPQAFAPDVRLRMLNAPSMNLVTKGADGELIYSGEAMVGLRAADGKFFIFALEARARLWDYTVDGQRQAAEYHLALHPATLAAITPKHCERRVDPAFAAQLIDVWQTMLAQAAPDPNAHDGVDGTEFYFSMGDARRGGGTWSPDDGRLLGLVNIAGEMQDWCRHPRPAGLAALESDVRTLGAQLHPDTGAAAR